MDGHALFRASLVVLNTKLVGIFDASATAARSKVTKSLTGQFGVRKHKIKVCI